MKKSGLVLVVFMAFISQVMAQGDVSSARLRTEEIIIDGVANEWIKPLNFYDDKTGMNFAICNDQNTLYFVLTCPEERKMRRIMSAGWTLQLTSKDKKNRFKASLAFPATKINWMGDRGERDPFAKKITANPMISTYQSQITAIEARGFQSDQHELMLNDRKGINLAIGADSLQHVVYEMAIPLKEFFTGGKFQPTEIITLNITVNAMKKPQMNSGVNEGYSDRSGGRSGDGRSMGRGRSGGGMSHGGRSRDFGSGEQGGLFEKASFKQKFTLAAN